MQHLRRRTLACTTNEQWWAYGLATTEHFYPIVRLGVKDILDVELFDLGECEMLPTFRYEEADTI